MTRLLSRQLRLAAGMLLLPLCLVIPPAWSKSGTPVAAPASDSQILDFMADWQGDDGQWTDPMTFARIDPAKVKADAAQRHGKPVSPPAGSTQAPAAAASTDHAAR